MLSKTNRGPEIPDPSVLAGRSHPRLIDQFAEKIAAFTMNPLSLLTRVGDKAGSLGAVISAMGCAMCFPAIASLGAALGMGFLSQWEGLFINTLKAPHSAARR